MKKEINETIMYMLRDNTPLEFDGGENENRLHLGGEYSIDVFAADMSKKEYKEMEKDMDKKIIRGKGYLVYAWNDSSGYDYWSENKHDYNYINITISIDNTDLVDKAQMVSDAIELYDYFKQYDNKDYHDFSDYGKE